jgi:hypothetical protein
MQHPEFSLENQKKIDYYVELLAVGGRKNVNIYFRKIRCIGFVWLRTRISAGFCEHENEPLGSTKKKLNSMV